MSAIAPVDRLWAEFCALDAEARGKFLTHLVHDNSLRSELEDHLDLEVARIRSAESTKPLGVISSANI